MATDADDHRRSRPRHAAKEAAEALEVLAPGAVEHAAGAEEHEPLHERVVPEVQEATAEAERRDPRMSASSGPPSEPEPDQHDADVLDARVRERPLHVALVEGERDAQQPSDHAERQQDGPRPRRRRQEGERAQDAVQAELDEHAGHQRRHVRGSRGVRLREPDVQGHDAGLDAEADGRQREDDHGERATGRMRRVRR